MVRGLTIELDAPLAERLKKAPAEAGVSVDQRCDGLVMLRVSHAREQRP